MTIEIFLLGLAVCAAFTGLVTEAVKRLLDEAKKSYHSNLLAAICSIIVATIVVVAYVLIREIPVTTAFVAESVLLAILSWLCSMVGYDKVVQTIKQVVGDKSIKEETKNE